MKTKGKTFFQEFKDFAMKGNILDLAVGVVIGGAFNKIVSSLVKDVIMPLVGLLTGGVNFEYLTLILKPEENGNPAVVLNYGIFIQNIVDFIIIALSIFIMIKVINKLNRKKEEVKEKKISKEEVLLTEIRDVLQELNSKKTVKDDI